MTNLCAISYRRGPDPVTLLLLAAFFIGCADQASSSVGDETAGTGGVLGDGAAGNVSAGYGGRVEVSSGGATSAGTLGLGSAGTSVSTGYGGRVEISSGGATSAGTLGLGSAGTSTAAVVTNCNERRTFPDCGTCSMTLEAYCSAPNTCELDESSVCQRIWWGSTWARGCGYIRVNYWGDVGDRVTKIWDQASHKLVYYWFNGMLSAGCLPDTRVGTEPSCDVWTDACGAGGAGGAGGTAGAAGAAGLANLH